MWLSHQFEYHFKFFNYFLSKLENRLKLKNRLKFLRCASEDICNLILVSSFSKVIRNRLKILKSF